MSDYGNTPPDEPTRAYTPVSDDATRLERPIEPYSEQRAAVPPTVLPPGYDDKSGISPAALIAVGLLCILIGIGLGYALFHSSSSSDLPLATTTTVAPMTTTTEATTTSSSTTSTTVKATTTTSTRATTTTTSTTVKPTTTLKTTTTLPVTTD